VRREHAIAAARPHHGHAGDRLGAPAPVTLQHPPERLVGEDAREVVHAAVPLRLADHRHDLVGGEATGEDRRLEAGGILHGLELDLGHLGCHRLVLPGQRVSRGPCPPGQAGGRGSAISSLARRTARTMFW
jgi:hypothetical protein